MIHHCIVLVKARSHLISHALRPKGVLYLSSVAKNGLNNLVVGVIY